MLIADTVYDILLMKLQQSNSYIWNIEYLFSAKKTWSIMQWNMIFLSPFVTWIYIGWYTRYTCMFASLHVRTSFIVVWLIKLSEWKFMVKVRQMKAKAELCYINHKLKYRKLSSSTFQKAGILVRVISFSSNQYMSACMKITVVI